MNKFFLVNFLLACYSIFSSKKKTFCGFLFQILLVLASIITNIRAIVSNFFSSSTNKHRRTSHFYQILFLCIRSFIKYKYLYVFNQLLLNIWAREINRISVVCKFMIHDRPFPKPINPASIGCILSCSVMIKCWLERNKTYWQFLNASKRMLHTWNSCKPKLLKL